MNNTYLDLSTHDCLALSPSPPRPKGSPGGSGLQQKSHDFSLLGLLGGEVVIIVTSVIGVGKTGCHFYQPMTGNGKHPT
jgi:hypothetical protein